MKFDGINIELIITIIYPGGFLWQRVRKATRD